MNEDLPLRKVDAMNSMELSLSLYTKRIPIEGAPFIGIIDAESELVCLVPDRDYKDWNHATTVRKLLEWAVENYPYREVD